MVLLGPALIAAATLVVSGVAKLVQPESASGAFTALALPDSRAAARVVGLVEIVLALTVIAVGGPAYVILGFWYAALAVAALRLVRAGSASCGCFGADSAPPSSLHVAANVVLAVFAIGAAIVGLGSLSTELVDLGWGASLLLVAWVAIGTSLVVAVYRVLPLVSAQLSRDLDEVPTFRAVNR